MLERLQKILARAGVASRRTCEGIIAAGRVSIDGQVVTELGAKADIGTQDVRLDGQRLRPAPLEYWILNKPKGVVCTNDDPAGRTRPVDLIPGSRARLFPVGRLDANSQGLLLMTNDGALANRLTHPRYEVPKTYRATVSGYVSNEDVRRLVRGVHLAEAKTQRARVEVLKRGRSRSILRITIREGRNRQIRRMLARLKHPVRELVRTRIGRLSLRGLGSGKARRLKPDDVQYLRRLPDEPPPAPSPQPKGSGRSRKKAKRQAAPSKNPPAGTDAKRSGRRKTKRSTHRHDSDGTGKTRRNQRRGPSGGGRRGNRAGKPSATRRRRPGGDSAQ